MEIYKLSDDILDSRLTKKRKYDIIQEDASKDAGVSDGAIKITDIKQAVKNPNRVNIFVNGKYVFSLDVAQVVDLGIKIGLVISKEDLARYKEASEYGKEYQRALEWVLVRPRSVKELREYLTRRKRIRDTKERKNTWQKEKELAEAVASGNEAEIRRIQKRLIRTKKRDKYDFDDLIVNRLCERGYVDDRKFAEYYVENRFVKKGISRKRLKMELIRKGIAKDVVEEVVDVRNDEEEIRKIIAKKYTKYTPEKLMQYLCRQGFDYQLVQDLVRTYEKD